MKKDTINFSTNWNNKLDCNSFTTIRLRNPLKYRVGRIYKVFLKREFKKQMMIEAITTIYLKDINEFIARLDTGYSAHETKALLKKFYPKIKNIEIQPFHFILLKTVK